MSSLRHHHAIERSLREDGSEMPTLFEMEKPMLAEAEVLPPEAKDIAIVVRDNPGIVLLNRKAFDAWLDSLSADAPKDVDILTRKGRDELRSYAADVRSKKANIKRERLRMTEEWRSMTSQANAAGKEIDERLETLAATVRQPLTDWEAAEEARESECKATIASLRTAAIVELGDTAADIRQRGMDVWNTALDPDRFGAMLDEAQAAKDSAVATLKAALVRLEKEEADLAELQKLREEAAARQRIDEEKRAAEAAEQARIEADRVAAERKAAAAEAEAARIRAAEEAAAQAARDAEARKAREEQDARDREHAAALKAERDRAEQLEAGRVAEAKRLADEQAERDANKAHRARVKRAAKEAIMTCGVSEDAAQKIVLAIIAGEVPAVSLRF